MDLEIEVIKDRDRDQPVLVRGSLIKGTIQADDCIIRRVGGSFFNFGLQLIYHTQTPLLASFLVSILRVGGSGGERDDSGKTVT